MHDNIDQILTDNRFEVPPGFKQSLRERLTAGQDGAQPVRMGHQPAEQTVPRRYSPARFAAFAALMLMVMCGAVLGTLWLMESDGFAQVSVVETLTPTAAPTALPPPEGGLSPFLQHAVSFAEADSVLDLPLREPLYLPDGVGIGGWHAVPPEDDSEGRHTAILLLVDPNDNIMMDLIIADHAVRTTTEPDTLTLAGIGQASVQESYCVHSDEGGRREQGSCPDGMYQVNWRSIQWTDEYGYFHSLGTEFSDRFSLEQMITIVESLGPSPAPEPTPAPAPCRATYHNPAVGICIDTPADADILEGGIGGGSPVMVAVAAAEHDSADGLYVFTEIIYGGYQLVGSAARCTRTFTGDDDHRRV